MAKKKVSFKIQPLRERIEVWLLAELETGEDVRLLHVFREPTAADKKLYYGELTGAELRDRREGQTRAGQGLFDAIEALYNACIIEIGGDYEIEEGIKEWKPLVPIEHKRFAIERLLSVGVTIKDESLKNL